MVRGDSYAYFDPQSRVRAKFGGFCIKIIFPKMADVGEKLTNKINRKEWYDKYSDSQISLLEKEGKPLAYAPQSTQMMDLLGLVHSPRSQDANRYFFSQKAINDSSSDSVIILLL